MGLRRRRGFTPREGQLAEYFELAKLTGEDAETPTAIAAREELLAIGRNPTGDDYQFLLGHGSTEFTELAERLRTSAQIQMYRPLTRQLRSAWEPVLNGDEINAEQLRAAMEALRRIQSIANGSMQSSVQTSPEDYVPTANQGPLTPDAWTQLFDALGDTPAAIDEHFASLSARLITTLLQDSKSIETDHELPDLIDEVRGLIDRAYPPGSREISWVQLELNMLIARTNPGRLEAFYGVGEAGSFFAELFVRLAIGGEVDPTVRTAVAMAVLREHPEIRLTLPGGTAARLQMEFHNAATARLQAGAATPGDNPTKP